MVKRAIPDKGDIVYLNFSPQSGHEQAGHRPALVLSPKQFNKSVFLIACPITSQVKGYPFEVEIPKGLPIQGVILVDQLRSVDWRSRGLKIKCQAPDDVVQDCLDIISTFIS